MRISEPSRKVLTRRLELRPENGFKERSALVRSRAHGLVVMTTPLHGVDHRFKSGWAHLSSRFASEKPIGEERRFWHGGTAMVDLMHVLEGLAYVGFIAGAFFAVVELRTMSRDRKIESKLRETE